MATPTSALDFDNVVSYITNRFTDGSPSAGMQNTIDEVVQTGYNKFLQAHDWSFLQTTVTVSLSSGDTEYVLPDDFTGFIGDVTIDVGGQTKTLVAQTAPEKIVNYSTEAFGYPSFFCVTSTGDQTAGQSWLMTLWPAVSGDAVEMTYRYANATDLTVTGNQFLGGSGFAEVIRQACAAEWETWMGGVNGREKKNYDDMLERAKQKDLETRIATVSMRRRGDYTSPRYTLPTITY
jgi:hypothetical protein